MDLGGLDKIVAQPFKALRQHALEYLLHRVRLELGVLRQPECGLLSVARGILRPLKARILASDRRTLP